jgi:hypothetical protein
MIRMTGDVHQLLLESLTSVNFLLATLPMEKLSIDEIMSLMRIH